MGTTGTPTERVRKAAEPKGGYPAEIVTDDGWGRIHRGHGLDPVTLRDDYEEHVGLPRGFELQIVEVWFGFIPRVKRCERYVGWPCDEEGQWHGHWYEARPAPGREFTVVTAQRPETLS